MSDFLREKVPPMPPISMAKIEEIGNKALQLLCPEALDTPQALDFCKLVDLGLPKFHVHVYPAAEVELGDRLAATDPSGDRDINILLARDLYDSLFQGGRMAHRARATIAHELGHAILHVREVRERVKYSQSGLLLNRVRRDALRPYEDPEWQAWALGGCIVAPRQMVESTNAETIADLADIFGVSEGMMRSHVKRLRLARRFGET